MYRAGRPRTSKIVRVASACPADPVGVSPPARTLSGAPGDRRRGSVMGTPCRLAIVFALGLAAVAAGQETPYGRATTLPATELHHGLPDLTPPELLHQPIPVVEAEPPAGGFYAAIEFLCLTPR